MTTSEIFAGVQFVVGKDGQPTAALLDIAAWHAIVDLLEEAEDQGLFRSYLARRAAANSPEEMGAIPWEKAKADLDDIESVPDATVD
jgi:hypothetical protein